ncbi:hypothetical protein Tco_0871588, partial [Tanacetum coccineum]
TNKRTLIRIVVVVVRGGCGGDDEEGSRLRLWWRVGGEDGDGEVAVAVCGGDGEAHGDEWWRLTWGIGHLLITAENDLQVMQKYGTNGPEDEYERVFWGDLKTMFDPPVSTDPVWNLPYQQKMLRWRYYDTCRVHCLTLKSANIYMLTNRRYPIPADVCQAMLDKKLQGDKKDEACYQMLKLIEKQAHNKLC